MMQTTVLTPEQKARMNALREREDELTPNEATELAGLFQIIEDAEAVYLGPANEKLRQERQRLEAQNAAFRELVKRKQVMVARMQAVLQETQAERQAINAEVARLLVDTEVKEAVPVG